MTKLLKWTTKVMTDPWFPVWGPGEAYLVELDQFGRLGLAGRHRWYEGYHYGMSSVITLPYGRRTGAAKTGGL